MSRCFICDKEEKHEYKGFICDECFEELEEFAAELEGKNV